MNIIKHGIDLKFLEKLKEAEHIAKLGCDKCPCCGETKTTNDYYFDEHIISKGIEDDGVVRKWVGRMKDKKLYETAYYKCLTCGARWESEPYEVLKER